MSGAAELRKTIDSSRSALLAASLQAKERARIGHANESKVRELTDSIDKTVAIRDALRETINYINSLYKEVGIYAANRKKLSLSMLASAIEKAGYIVPDAKTAGIKLDIKEKKARIVDARGTDVNKREGSAYRTVLGILIRYTLLKTDPNAIQAMFLDEYFSTLSDETIANVREYLDCFKEDTLIVAIEQHDTLSQGIEKTEYRAIKTGDKTVILKEN